MLESPVRTVGDWDDPSGVDHLSYHHDVVLGLEDLDVVVVGQWIDRESGIAEAPVEVTQVFRALKRSGAE